MTRIVILTLLLAAATLPVGGCRKKQPQAPKAPQAPSAPAVEKDSAAAPYKAGRQLAMQGQFDEAVEQFNKAIELEPGYYQAYDKLAMLYYSKGEHETAAGLLDKAVTLNPALTKADADPADVALAAQDCAMLLDVGRGQEALEHLTALSGLHPDAPTVKTVQLFCKLAEEEKGTAPLLFEHFSATDIDTCQKYLLLAKGYVFLGNADAAMNYYQKVADTCGADPEALTQAAYYFAMARKPDTAISICDTGLKDHAAYYPLRYVLTSVYSALALPDEAIETANDGVLASPHDVRCYYLLANMYMKADRYGAAAGVYDAMLSYVEKDPAYFTAAPAEPQNPDTPLEMVEPEETEIAREFNKTEVYANLAMCYNRTKNFQKAELYANKAIQSDASFLSAYAHLSGALQGQSKFDEAQDAIDKGIKLAPDSPTMYLEKAALFHQTNDFQKAIEPLKKALELDPRNASAYQGLAQTYGKMERYEDALPYFEKAAQNRPDMMNVGNLVACLVRLERKQQALDAFKSYTGEDNASFVVICCKDGERALSDKRYDDAARSYRTALFADAKSVQALFGLGRAEAAAGRVENAAKIVHLLDELDAGLSDQLSEIIAASRK